MGNRLANSQSPYLVSHQDNPVDWYPWGEEAFAEARRRDVPLLISVGYSACHWCHVMAHESFEDPGTAALMNERFVSVKVDREERPDVDAIYMTATQAMTGQGGWPMTVFATPDGHPFYAGTYFPRPQFRQLLMGVSQAWANDRAAVADQGAHVVRVLNERSSVPRGPLPAPADLDRAVAALRREFDTVNGGFGTAPKFPPSMALEFLLRQGGDDALAMAGATLEAMARGGMYDQLAGGFARYSVDATWTVPHFEKMLYDNALLLRVYTHWWRITGSPLARRVALETAGWLLAEMRTPEGGFASALDADSEGVEGKFYVWTPGELREVLGDDDAAWAQELFGVTAAGTFEHGASVLQLRADPDDSARYERVRRTLRAARDRRVRPGRDDKVVAAWNGLAIAALAEAGILFDRSDLVTAARDAADLLARVHGLPEPAPDERAHDEHAHDEPGQDRPAQDAPAQDGPTQDQPTQDQPIQDQTAQGRPTQDRHGHEGYAYDGHGRDGGGREGAGSGRIGRTSRDGRAGGNAGLLEDYGDLAEGLLALFGVTGEARWFHWAGELLGTVLDRFADGSGGFFDTPDDGEELFQRPRDPTDNATPSGRFAAAGALLSYAALTGSARHREAAEAALGVVTLLAGEHARFAGWGLAVAAAALDGPVEVAVVGPADDTRTGALRMAALMAAPAGAVLALGDGAGDAGVPLLEGRGPIDGSPAAYVCRGFTCRMPVTTPDDLRAQLGDT